MNQCNKCGGGLVKHNGYWRCPACIFGAAPSPQPSAEATLPTQTRISRACIAAANHLKELHVITYEANTVADIIYRHIRQALMEEYDGKL